MFVTQPTSNPLGKRPFNFYASRYGLSGLGDITEDPQVPQAAAQSPSGSSFMYSTQWAATIGLVSPDMVIAALANQLPQYGMSVKSSSIVSGGWTIGLTGGSISVQVQDSIGHALLSDAQSVLDHVVRTVVGDSNFGGSSIALTSVPGTGGVAAPPGTASTFGQWLQANAAVAGVAIAAVILGTTWLKNR